MERSAENVSGDGPLVESVAVAGNQGILSGVGESLTFVPPFATSGGGGGSSAAGMSLTSPMNASCNSEVQTVRPGSDGICPADLPENFGKKQLIVNYVSHQVGDEEFRAVFEQFGPIDESRIIRDKHSLRSKGFGFVYFQDASDAAAAVRALNGFELYEKWIKVGYADPQRPYVSPTASATPSASNSRTDTALASAAGVAGGGQSGLSGSGAPGATVSTLQHRSSGSSGAGSSGASPMNAGHRTGLPAVKMPRIPKNGVEDDDD